MKIAQATPEMVQGLWKSVEPNVAGAKRFEEAAQALAEAVHKNFEESVVIARLFLTVPFESLPGTNRDFVGKLVESARSTASLKPSVPVLSLVGTHGREASWCDRRKSKGHMGIPLISSAFVGGIPMISRLLKELGVPIDWVDSHDANMIVDHLGESAGVFFVADAGSATDHEGRKIIAAQDFVSGSGVKSVFGVGGAYPDGQIVVLVIFCSDKLTRATAEHFLPLLNSFRAKTKSLAGPNRVFSNGS